VQVSSDGSHLILVVNTVHHEAVDEGDRVMVHDSSTGKRLLATHPLGSVNSTRLTPDGNRLVVESTLGGLRPERADYLGPGNREAAREQETKLDCCR